MKHSASSMPSRDRTRRANILFAVVTLLLALGVIANMALIFCMSAEDSIESGDRSSGVTDLVVNVVYPDFEQKSPEVQENIFTSMHHTVRKMAHFSEFALLGLLSALLTAQLSRRISFLRVYLQWCLPVIHCLLYAASDEIHQIFTNRGPAVKDVLIDFGGALVGILIARLLVWFAGHIRRTARIRARKKVSAA